MDRPLGVVAPAPVVPRRVAVDRLVEAEECRCGGGEVRFDARVRWPAAPAITQSRAARQRLGCFQRRRRWRRSSWRMRAGVDITCACVPVAIAVLPFPRILKEPKAAIPARWLPRPSLDPSTLPKELVEAVVRIAPEAPAEMVIERLWRRGRRRKRRRRRWRR